MSLDIISTHGNVSDEVVLVWWKTNLLPPSFVDAKAYAD